MASQDAPPKASRLAPPSLFVPPSRNISTTDLSTERPPTSRTPTSTRAPLLRQRSTTKGNQAEAVAPPTSEPSTAGSPRQAPSNQHQQTRRRTRKSSSTSQTWAELQNTLEEVELSAASGANVFGAEHSRALEELRKAQVELAKAWARGEEGEEQGNENGIGEGLSLHNEGSQPNMREASAVLASDRSSKMGAGGSQRAGKDTGAGTKFGSKKSQLEEETENDILLARKRRLANDKYFERVNKGVVDVVAKLEIVADKMGEVELESQEIWGDKDSLDSESVV